MKTTKGFEIIPSPPSALINGKKIQLTVYNDKIESEATCQLGDLKGVSTSQYPDLFILNINFLEDIKIKNARRCYIYRADGKFSLTISFCDEPDIWDDTIVTKAVYREVYSIIAGEKYCQELKVDFENGDLYIHADLTDSDEDIFELLQRKLLLTSELIDDAESKIFGFKWNKEHSVSESKLTKELIIPLLIAMGYCHVRHNHGPKEYGRDILFSEIDKFGNFRRLAAQIKAGDIGGGANSLIDTIISQIDDAFSMPVEGPCQSKSYYISEFFIVASGKISENAIKKINSKIDSRLIGSINFVDRDDIEWLVRKNWPLSM